MPGPGRHRGRYSQAVRLLLILEELRGRRRGMSLAELAREFNVVERQMRRDLEALEQAQFDLDYFKVHGRSHVRLLEAGPGKIWLSQRQRYVLLAARRVFDVLRETPFHDDIRTIFGKVVESLPEEQQADVEALRDRFVYVPDGGAKAYDGFGDTINGLLTGVLKRRKVTCRYALPGRGPYRMTLEPYAMVLYKHGLYVLGRSLPGAEAEGSRAAPGAEADAALVAEAPVRVYAVERFTDAEFVKGASFQVPPDFRVEDFFDGAFGIFVGGEPQTVVVDFTPAARDLVEARIWHPSQRVKPLRGGGVRLEMDVVNLTQVCPWILGWGPLAVVRKPPELVARVKEELAQAAARYR